MDSEESAGITRMKEPRTAENQEGQGSTNAADRPAICIDVMATHEDKEFALKGLLCRES